MSQRRTISECQLCLEQASLARSHVIPEFLYRIVYDGENRIYRLLVNRGKKTPVEVGFRTPLLCARCEGYLNDEFEQPFRRAWLEGGLAPTIVTAELYKVNVPDYRRFKLFLLSIVFRAGVCNRAPFASVDLREHVAVLRDMIKTGRAGSAAEYPILGDVILAPDQRQVFTAVSSAFETPWNETRAYSFAFGGCLWQFPLTASGAGQLEPLTLHEDGSMTFRVIDMWKIPPLRESFEKHATAAANIRRRK